MRKGEGLLATWPKTGHRLVRALDQETWELLMYGGEPPADDDDRFHRDMRYTEDEVGSSMTLFIVDLGEERARVQVGIEMNARVMWGTMAGGWSGGRRDSVGNGLFRSVWPFLPQDFPSWGNPQAEGPSGMRLDDWWTKRAGEARGGVDPGPLVPAKDFLVFRLLGVPPPWYGSSDELKVFLEEDS